MSNQSLLNHPPSQHWMLAEPPKLPLYRPPQQHHGRSSPTSDISKHVPLFSPRFTSRLSFRRAIILITATISLYLVAVVYPSQVGKLGRAAIYLGRAHDTAACAATETNDALYLTPSKLFQFSDWNSPYDNHYVSLYPPLLQQAEGDPAPKTTEGPELPLSCLENHIALGTPCRNPENNPTLDVVWTYVNGSDALHKDAYLENLADVRLAHPKMYYPPPKKGTFREFDELRFSLRSLVAGFRDSAHKLFLVTSDFPYPGCNGTSPWRLGQLPQWLPKGQAGEVWKDGKLELQVVHHTSIFPPLENRSIFNSLAIESRLHHLDGLSDYFVYMNDDVFVNSNLSIYDFYSRDFGPVFRMQSDLLVGGKAARNGEWVALQHSNDLLNSRFGERSRPYLAHLSKTMGVPFLREISAIWSSELHLTASHPFRSLTQFDPDVSTTLLMTHYVVERWREILVWSFIVASIGGDEDQWDAEHNRKAWRSLGGTSDQAELEVVRGVRTTLQKMNETVFGENFHGRKGQTKYLYSSFDGYPYSGLGRRGLKQFPDFSEPQVEKIQGGNPKIEKPRIHDGAKCTLERDRCFTLPEGVSSTASEVFKHVAFREPDCGDCIIHALLNKCGTLGLEALLPDSSRTFPTQSRPFFGARESTPRLPLTSNWTTTDFSLLSIPFSDLSLRQWVAQAMLRYRFVLGTTPSTFVQLETVSSAARHLRNIDKLRGQKNDPAILCLNDDVAFNDKVVRVNLINWLSERWPRKAEWEIS